MSRFLTILTDVDETGFSSFRNHKEVIDDSLFNDGGEWAIDKLETRSQACPDETSDDVTSACLYAAGCLTVNCAVVVTVAAPARSRRAKLFLSSAQFTYTWHERWTHCVSVVRRGCSWLTVNCDRDRIGILHYTSSSHVCPLFDVAAVAALWTAI